MKSNLNKALSNGDRIKITWLPDICGEISAYIGYEGIVYDLDKSGSFNLFSGSSWLVGLDVAQVRYDLIKKSQGVFKINGVSYYSSEDNVIHKAKKCCKCKLIPEEYIMVNGFFRKRYYCSNCIKKS